MSPINDTSQALVTVKGSETAGTGKDEVSAGKGMTVIDQGKVNELQQIIASLQLHEVS
jgi:hypothetical protein